jgi:DNA-3-methyladenine glycosylase II
VHIILEQQVSLASAKAAFARLQEAADPLTPERFLEFTDDQLKAIGFSRQKSGYCRELSRSILHGDLDLDGLACMDDEAIRARLMEVKGIGRWTADIYLLMAMLRPDVWPSGDLAIASAVQKIKDLPKRPAPDELEAIARPWKPWRAEAARILWHYYLSGDNN